MRPDSAPWACPSAPGAVECETGVPRPSGRCARLRAEDASGRRPPTRQALRVGEAPASVPSALGPVGAPGSGDPGRRGLALL